MFYLLFINRYGGPNSQYVKQTFDTGFELTMAASGFIALVVDPRGTGFKGRAFRSIVSKNLGFYESQDVISAAKHFINLGFVDEKRISVWGWVCIFIIIIIITC